MNNLRLAAAALAGAAAAMPAAATVIDAKFSGTVASQTSTSFAVGAAISGEFLYDTAAAQYLSFVIGGQSVASGFASTAAVTPDRYSAIYQAQLSPVPLPGTRNDTFTVDLEGQNPWPSNDAVALLTNGSQLASNLDTTLSSFGFYDAAANGTDVHSLNATLSTVQIAAVPEPSTAVLLLLGVAAVARRLRHSKAD